MGRETVVILGHDHFEALLGRLNAADLEHLYCGRMPAIR